MNKLNSIVGSLNVITGCGSGLGKATLLRFLKNGCGAVLGIDREYAENFEEDLKLDNELRAKLTLRRHNTFDEAVGSSVKEFVEKHGHVDNLINVAGVSLAFQLYNEDKCRIYDLEHAKPLVEFNTVGTFNMIRQVAKFMIEDTANKNKLKNIINASCISTTNPAAGQTFYAGSKAALDSMTLCIARELSPFNIKCNTINVGYFDTPLVYASDIRVVHYLANEMTLCPKKLGDPEEFAHLVQVMIENPMLNGTCVKLDGAALCAQETF